MPELAEVETVRNVLKGKILNKKINSIDIYYDKMIENNINEFKEKLINKEFIDIQRKGKYLIFETEDNYLISHLRMEGKYFIKNRIDPKDKHEHVIFHCQDFDLRYADTRKFGRMKLIDKSFLKEYFKDLGPDANSNPDSKDIYEKVRNKNLPIKTILLDQSVISGLGNIYVDEVLFKAKINPFKKGKEITLKDIENILKYSKEVLDKAIYYKGTTIRSYTSQLGVKGGYQEFLCVHTKEICPCGEKIQKKKIGGRTTYYCPVCQDVK